MIKESHKENPMRQNILRLAIMLSVLGGSVQAQPGTDYDAHIKAAKDAAKFDWVGVFARNCIAPRIGPAIGNDNTDPGRAVWYAETQKIFDNFYFLGTKFHTAWALNTSDGIVIIDTLYQYASEPEIVDGLKKLGLDPARIKYVLITHGHGDHDQGARLLQDRYGAKVALGAADWDLVDKAKSFSGGKPRKELSITDGQKITLGDTTLTAISTPGHTPGAYGLIFQVKDRGRPVTVAYASGTAFTAYTRSWFDQFIDSQKKLASAAQAAGATVLISNHTAFDDAWTKARLAAWRPAGEPNPFVIGSDAVQNYFKVLEECSLAQQSQLPQ
ncbi:MAG: hypothetical protein JWP16_1530 [Alphaproteobacteria bacterium]|nr:hypothetical protein [Alphaproteobacteria bacterium]